MSKPTDRPPPNEPEDAPVVERWGDDVVGEAYHLAMLGAQRLLAGEFLEANRLLRAAAHLANRGAFLTQGYGRRPRDES
jgi:hypothetical protein